MLVKVERKVAEDIAYRYAALCEKLRDRLRCAAAERALEVGEFDNGDRRIRRSARGRGVADKVCHINRRGLGHRDAIPCGVVLCGFGETRADGSAESLCALRAPQCVAVDKNGRRLRDTERDSFSKIVLYLRAISVLVQVAGETSHIEMKQLRIPDVLLARHLL